MDMDDTEESKDLLGRTYEYCIAQFAAYEGVKGGEFYTPSSIVKTIVAILKPFSNCRVYDPCCGSGGMFVQSAKFVKAHSGTRGELSVYGQESNADTWKMAKMNMAIRGIEANFGPYQADTFFNDLHPTLKADFIMANPPFNLSNWGQDKLKEDKRWKFGVPPAGNANYAWIQHMIHHLAPNGKIGLVLANGALSSQASGEGEIRKNIIQADLIEGIVALPTQLFYSVTIPVTLWFISKNKKQKGKTLFIDARKMGHMVDRKHRDFADEDIQKLADTFESFQNGTLEDVKGFCAVADLQEIEKQDFILTPGRYVGIEEVEDDGEPFEDKMKRLTSELSDMFAKSHELEDEIRKKLALISQEATLFPMSIADNIRIGNPDVSNEEIIMALKMSGCEEFIKALPEGIDTVLTEKGNNLSGGQRQRLTIARAIVKNAPIFLLDEPTSALDQETENTICKTFDEVARNHTVIAVAHRLNTIKNYDRIYVLEHGRIVEQGTHKELLNQQGRYYQMYQDYSREEIE